MNALILLVLLTTAGELFAFTRAGTTAAQFMKLPLSARSAAIAGADLAGMPGWLSDYGMAEQMLSNPASIAGIDRPATAFSQQRLWGDLDHGLVSGVLPLSEHWALGASLNWLNAADQEITTLEQPTGTGASYSYSDLAFALSTGLRMNERLSFGVTGRYLRQNLHNERAEGWAVDLACLLLTPWRNVRLGCAIQNFGTRMQLEGEDLLIPSNDGRVSHLKTNDFAQPLTFKLGLAGPAWRLGAQKLDWNIQAEHPNDNRERLGLGLEYSVRGQFFLRAGRKFRSDLERFSAGAGIRHKLPRSQMTVSIDAAWVQTDRFEDFKLFSVGLGF